jgi:hypothetical protein
LSSHREETPRFEGDSERGQFIMPREQIEPKKGDKRYVCLACLCCLNLQHWTLTVMPWFRVYLRGIEQGRSWLATNEVEVLQEFIRKKASELKEDAILACRLAEIQ